MPRRFLCWFLAMVLMAGAASAQTPQADRIRQQVGKTGVLGNLTCSGRGGPGQCGGC